MTKKIIFPVIFGILVLGLFGFSENGYANHAPPYTGTDAARNIGSLAENHNGLPGDR